MTPEEIEAYEAAGLVQDPFSQSWVDSAGTRWVEAHPGLPGGGLRMVGGPPAWTLDEGFEDFNPYRLRPVTWVQPTRARCSECARELCSELDHYWGVDPEEAKKCDACRRGRKG